ncbi:putative ribonuclease H-like domain-containing protein [Tanacetum coccineum]
MLSKNATVGVSYAELSETFKPSIGNMSGKVECLKDSQHVVSERVALDLGSQGSKEVIDIDVQTEEAAELMVVSSTSLTEAPRKAAVSEKIAKKKTHSPKQPSSTPISKSADDIMTFRKELDAIAVKHLVITGNIEAIYPSAVHEKEVFSDADDDEMPEIRIYDKSSEGLFDKASYDDDGIITDFNNLPDEVDVSTNHYLRIHTVILKKVSEALEDESWIEAMQEELLQFKLQQVWVLVDLPIGAKEIRTKWYTGNKRILEAIRLFLAFASFMGFIVYQMDVKSAFLYGTIEEEVYVSQPPGVKFAITPRETKASLLKMKQS